ncbi:hypothetical protein BKA81DRAFT_56675 [Phyllosticta paracitricarpa]
MQGTASVNTQRAINPAIARRRSTAQWLDQTTRAAPSAPSPTRLDVRNKVEETSHHIRPMPRRLNPRPQNIIFQSLVSARTLVSSLAQCRASPQPESTSQSTVQPDSSPTSNPTSSCPAQPGASNGEGSGSRPSGIVSAMQGGGQANRPGSQSVSRAAASAICIRWMRSSEQE